MSLFCHFFDCFDENVLTDRISKSVNLRIFMISCHEPSFPPRKLKFSTIVKAETKPTGTKIDFARCQLSRGGRLEFAVFARRRRKILSFLIAENAISKGKSMKN